MGLEDGGFLTPCPLPPTYTFPSEVSSILGQSKGYRDSSQRKAGFTAALGHDTALTHPRTNSHSALQRSLKTPGYSRVSFQLRSQRKPAAESYGEDWGYLVLMLPEGLSSDTIILLYLNPFSSFL